MAALGRDEHDLNLLSVTLSTPRPADVEATDPRSRQQLMLAPEQDIGDRQPVWDALQMLFMDDDPHAHVEAIAHVCAQSKYSAQELESILLQEVLPTLRANLLALPAPEWRGFESQGLRELILARHRFGRRRPWLFRRYAHQWWLRIHSRVKQLRAINS